MENFVYYLQNSHFYIDLKIQGMDNIHAYKQGMWLLIHAPTSAAD